jgi:hypothetical protein
MKELQEKHSEMPRGTDYDHFCQLKARQTIIAQQATIYDRRFANTVEVNQQAVNDKAGVEEIRDVMETEGHVFQSELRRLREKEGKFIAVVDFGCGDGRYLFEFMRDGVMLEGWGKELYVIGYEVS